jgi:hypothetical protein
MEMNNVQQALYSLVKRYVERQKLVLEVMRDLRPDMIMRIENRGNAEFWATWTRERWQAFVLENARKSATGYWGDNDEWEYRLHGAGCCLTHRKTQEPIEWDLGSLRRFDRFWFVNHLNWLLDQNTEDEAISTVKKWYENEAKLKQPPKPSYGPLHDAVFSMLEQLHQMGLLSQHQQYYTLISSETSTASL